MPLSLWPQVTQQGCPAFQQVHQGVHGEQSVDQVAGRQNVCLRMTCALVEDYTLLPF